MKPTCGRVVTGFKRSRTRPQVGFIGLGIMGRPMAGHVLEAGFPLTVHSRSRPPVDQLVAAGAAAAASPAEVAAASDLVITMLPDTPDVEAVLLGKRGVIEGLRPGSVVVDMSTIDPMAARRIAERFAQASSQMLDAPVSGGQVGAEAGTLSIMVGGSAEALERVMPVLEAMGRTIVRIGDSGAGQVAKAANQLLVAANIQGVAEALVLAAGAGVDPAAVREALLGGFAQSRVLELHGRRMLEGEFNPGARVRMHVKDARIVRTLAVELGVPLRMFEQAADSLDRLAESGRADLDHSALVLLVEEEAGVSLRPTGGEAGGS
jgi:2-hydroxy-3-oxopropionate reductase